MSITTGKHKTVGFENDYVNNLNKLYCFDKNGKGDSIYLRGAVVKIYTRNGNTDYIPLVYKTVKNNYKTKPSTLLKSKNNQLKNDKIKLINEQNENNLKSIALKNISQKIKELKELQNQGLLNEEEFIVKHESLLNIEINSIRDKQN